MNKQLTLAEFNGQSFLFGNRHVRVVITDDVPWFCAADIATALGYQRPRDFYSLINQKRKGAANYGTLGGDQQMVAIDEAGMYEGVLRCRLPQAEPFVDWVTATVLPAIRATGRYDASVDLAETGRLAAERDAARSALDELQDQMTLKDELLSLYRERPAVTPKAKKPAPEPLNDAERAEIVRLIDQGRSNREIAQRINRSTSAVYMIRREMNGGGA